MAESPRRSRLFDAVQLGGVLDDMARQAAGLPGRDLPLAVVGVLRRGAPLADLLAGRLAACGLPAVRRLDLAISRYADDLTLLYPETRLVEDRAASPPDLAGQRVLLVDDVLYTGHSLLRALEYLVRRGAEAVHAAVLADRCVTHLPLRADVVGLRLQVAAGDIVECRVPPYEPDFGIVVVHRPSGEGAEGGAT